MAKLIRSSQYEMLNIVLTCALQGNPEGEWQHDMYEGGPRKNNPRLGSPTAAAGSSKLVVSNLDFGVSDADIKVIL